MAGDGRFDGRIPHAPGGRFFQFEAGAMGKLGSAIMAGVPQVERMDHNAFRRQQIGCEIYPFVWMQTRRSRAGTFGFCWRSLRHSVMGTVIPASGEDTFGADQDGLIGRIEIDGEATRPKAICHTDHTTEKGFRTTGEIVYGKDQVTQCLSVVALEDGETVVFVDLTQAVDPERVTLNEGLGIYAMNDFPNNNHVAIAYEGGRNRVRGVGGKARVIETESPWMRVASCLGIATDGISLLYEDMSERNTPERWKSVLQDRIFVQPNAEGQTLRDFCVILRMGRGGARRAAKCPERLTVEADRVRAFRLADARNKPVTVVVNFGREATTVEIPDAGEITIPAMDTVVC